VRLGADGYITKPFDSASLGGIIAKNLCKKSGQAPTEKCAGAIADGEDRPVETETAKEWGLKLD